MNDPWEPLLIEARRVHQSSKELMEFCPFPDDIRRQDVDPFHIGSSDLLQSETGLFCTRYAALCDAFIAAAPHAHWRQTYKGTNVSPRFLDEFGCYCLIGAGGAFQSNQPHALETKDHPVMAYVVWRNGFDTPPVLTHKDAS